MELKVDETKTTSTKEDEEEEAQLEICQPGLAERLEDASSAPDASVQSASKSCDERVMRAKDARMQSHPNSVSMELDRQPAVKSGKTNEDEEAAAARKNKDDLRYKISSISLDHGQQQQQHVNLRPPADDRFAKLSTSGGGLEAQRQLHEAIQQQQQQQKPQSMQVNDDDLASTSKSELKQANNSAHQAPKSPNYASQRSQDTRTHVVGELYDTERSYVESLKILIEKYMKPLKSLDCNKSLIDSSLVDEIFHNLPEILEHHESFLGALQERLNSDWESSQRIANVLIETFTSQEIIETYTAFINNWKNARQAIKMATQARPAFERFLETMAREHKNKLTLDALLIMPVQRIPRYELLIKELIKHTNEDHPDYACLLEAQEKIHKLALKIDHAEKEMMHQEQLKDLEALIEGQIELQHPERDFLRYDLVTILSTSSLTIAKKERVLFLFCDLLIMTSLKKKSSKRTNLQLAFSNSYNDLSLLEGNKFKLLFKLSIDQVDVNIKDDQLAAMQAPEDVEQQRQLNLQLDSLKQVIECLQSDLNLLRKLERDGSGLSQQEHRNQLGAGVKELRKSIADKLELTKQSHEQLEQEVHEHKRKSLMNILPQQHFINQHPSATTLASLAGQQQQADQQPQQISSNNINNSLSPNFSLVSSGNNNQNGGSTSSSFSKISDSISNSNLTTTNSGLQQQQQADDQGTELELFIYNYSTNLSGIGAQQAQQATSDSYVIGPDSGPFQSINSNQHSISDIITTTADNQQQQQAANTSHDTLVIAFSSYDRRQAFLQSFVEAKNQRYHQHRHQAMLQQQRVFNSSANLKPQGHLLAINEDSKRKSSMKVDDPTKDDAKPSLVSSIPNSLNPLQIASTVSNLMNRISPTSLVGGGSSSNHNNNANNESSNNSDRGSHHPSSPMRHQLSAPTSLCAMENKQHQQREGFNTTNNSSLTIQQQDFQSYADQQHHHQSQHQLIHQPASHPGPTPIVYPCQAAACLANPPMTTALDHEATAKLRSQAARRLERVHEMMGSECCDVALDGQDNSSCNLQIGQSKSIYKWAPRFLNAIPLNFLNTQHMSMQFTCSILKHNFSLPVAQPQLSTTKNQLVRDRTGQFWVCLSNGLVSHVALLMMVKQRTYVASTDNQRATNTNIDYEPSANNSDTNNNNPQDELASSTNMIARYEIIPVVRSAGDVCKSQITSICQVNCSRKSARKRNSSTSYNSCINERPKSNEGASRCDTPTLTETQNEAIMQASSKNPEIAIESVSPPVDILSNRTSNQDNYRSVSSTQQASFSANINMGLSESAPTFSSKTGSPFVQLTQHDEINLAKSSRSKTEPDCKPVIHSMSNGDDDELLDVANDPKSSGCSTVARVHSLEPHSIRHLHQGHHFGFDCKHAQHQLHHHHHHHHIHSHHHNYITPSNVYGTRHNTVPMAQLRKSLERQTRIPKFGSNERADIASDGSKTADESSKNFTPTKAMDRITKKSFRPGKLLLHQSSFKTNSILARLVGGSKKSSRKNKQQSNKSPGELDLKDDDGTGTLDGGSSFSDLNQCIVSPLSSNASSLNSSATNSSITINSVCASSPNHSRCDLLIHSYSASCCAAPMTSYLASRLVNQMQQPEGAQNDHGLRSRSATVPSRPPSTQPPLIAPINCAPLNEQLDTNLDIFNNNNVSDLSQNNSCSSVNKLPLSASQQRDLDVSMEQQHLDLDTASSRTKLNINSTSTAISTALWLGCDDGSLMVIDCLANDNNTANTTTFDQLNQCNVCDMNQNGLECSNVHSEVKLEAPICDIILHEDSIVFVALANGQLVVFSRELAQDNNERDFDVYPCDEYCGDWSLTNPKIIKMATNEINTTSKICLVNKDYLWYSYGREIIVLHITQLAITQRIMAPSNNIQIQIPISINQMVLTGNGQGIWVVFNHSQIVQLYSVKNCLLMAELNIRDSITRMLLFGNEIIRHHKISTLKATSLLVVNNVGNNSMIDRVFIGTSAGLILSMDLSHDMLQFDKPADSSQVQQLDLKTRIVSLRHGHSGAVKFIHQIPLAPSSSHLDGTEWNQMISYQNSKTLDDNNEEQHKNHEVESVLVSGGAGIDLYGPDVTQRLQKMNVDNDDTSHLIVWRI